MFESLTYHLKRASIWVAFQKQQQQQVKELYDSSTVHSAFPKHGIHVFFIQFPKTKKINAQFKLNVLPKKKI